MLIAAIIAAAVVAVVVAVRSPKVPVQAVDDLRQLPKYLSTQLAAGAGLLAFLPDIVLQLQALLPQIEAVKGVGLLDGIFATDGYREFVGMLAVLAIVFRTVKLPSKPQ